MGDGEDWPEKLDAAASELARGRATALRLFVLGHNVGEAEAAKALGHGLDAGLALGALRTCGDGVQATLRIVPHDILLVASDLPSRDPADDHVVSAHLPSLTLARLTVRRRVRRALDLGTGNGIQALVLARHAERVVATDASERALQFTAFNAALNRIGTSRRGTEAGSGPSPASDQYTMSFAHIKQVWLPNGASVTIP